MALRIPKPSDGTGSKGRQMAKHVRTPVRRLIEAGSGRSPGFPETFISNDRQVSLGEFLNVPDPIRWLLEGGELILRGTDDPQNYPPNWRKKQ